EEAAARDEQDDPRPDHAQAAEQHHRPSGDLGAGRDLGDPGRDADRQEQVVEALVERHRADGRDLLLRPQPEPGGHTGPAEQQALHDEEPDVDRRRKEGSQLGDERHQATSRMIGARVTARMAWQIGESASWGSAPWARRWPPTSPGPVSRSRPGTGPPAEHRSLTLSASPGPTPPPTSRGRPTPW